MNKPVHRGQHWLQEKYNRRYLEFVRRYSDIIVGQFFGHQHSDSFRVFRDKNGKKSFDQYLIYMLQYPGKNVMSIKIII